MNASNIIRMVAALPQADLAGRMQIEVAIRNACDQRDRLARALRALDDAGSIEPSGPLYANAMEALRIAEVAS